MTLYEALEREYRQREEDYRIAKRERLDNALLPSLAIMNAIQRVLERAELPRLEETEKR
ncbi:MAG: hypothetical protein K8L99_02420 [Anaerolineae bacterium]|nr:hypothetical protein [Anaerolineae bacterium]